MNRWHQDEAHARGAQLTEIASALEPRPVDLAAGWESVVADARRERSVWWLPLSFVASAALGALIVVLFGSSIFAPPAPALIVSSNASWSNDADGTLTLRVGKVAMAQSSDRLIRVVTPHLTIEAHRCRFSAEVSTRGTIVTVDEGHVVIRAGSEAHTIEAGTSVTWPPAPRVPSTLIPMPHLDSPCAKNVECLSKESEGTGLEAQAALYELGFLQAGETAIETWSRSLARFPRGVLNPEVRLALLGELMRARRFSEALLAAREFETMCADDARRADVTQLRTSLERMP